MRSCLKCSFCLIFLLGFSLSGFSQWQPLDLSFGNGNSVKHMFSDPYSGDLILTGVITEVNNEVPYASVLRWNGSEVSGISGPADSGWTNIWGNGLAGVAHQGKLFIGGAFTHGMEGSPYPHWAIWDTSGTWDSSPYVINAVQAITLIDSVLYLAVSTTNGGLNPNCFYTYDGTNWDSISIEIPSTGLGGSFGAGMIRYENRYFCGGSFSENNGGSDIFEWLGGDEFIPAWPGQSGIGYISDMLVYNDELIVSGSFTEAFGNPGNCIAAYNGLDWHPLYNSNGFERLGFSAGIFDLLVNDGILYAVGAFDLIDGQDAHHAAWWDGDEWHGIGVPEFQNVRCAAVYHDTLYVGGVLNLDTFPSHRKLAKYLGELPSNPNSILEFSVGVDLTVYPNPTSAAIRLDWTSKENDVAVLSIIDVYGQEVMNIEVVSRIGENSKYFDVQMFASGVYGVVLKKEDTASSMKFIKM